MRWKHWMWIGLALIALMIGLLVLLGLLSRPLPSEEDHRAWFRAHHGGLECLRSAATRLTEQERKLATGLRPLVEECRADGVIAVYPGGPGFWRILTYTNRLSGLDDGTVGGFVFGAGIPASQIVPSLDELRRRPEREVTGFVALEDGWFLYEERW